MSRKSRRRKQRAANMPQPSEVTFTFAAARMLRDALRLVDEALSHTAQPLPNLQLGRETLENFKTKLEDMLQSEDWGKETPFDHNELHLLYAAIQRYLVHLSLTGNDPLMPTCLQLCKQFSAAIERAG